MAFYKYANQAVQTTLAASLSSVTPGTTGSVQVQSITGWPTTFPVRMILEWDTANVEVVKLTQAATGTGPFTFANSVRGADGSAAPAHSSGASVVHGPAAGDFYQGGEDWINVVAADYGADPTGTNDSTTAIQAALNAASPGQTVYLPVGTYKVSAPLVIWPYTTLRGVRGAIAAADLNASGGNFGSVLAPSASFATTLPVKGVINLLDNQSANANGFAFPNPPSPNNGITAGIHIRDVLIDGTASAASVDGIAAFGSIAPLRIDSVGIYKVTGNGISGKTNASSTASNKSPDGWHLNNVIVQAATGTGWGGAAGVGDGMSQDSELIDVHVQGCGGDGFGILSSNCRLLGCRSDFNLNGFTVDAFAAASGDDSIIFSGCGTQSNHSNGLNVVNTSGTGTSARSPVIVSACTFDGDGVNGGAGGGSFAGILVSGRNTVTISGTVVLAQTSQAASGCPQYGLNTASQGTGPGVPDLVSMQGGLLNAMGASSAGVHDGAPASILRVDPSVSQYVGAAYQNFASTPAQPVQMAPYLGAIQDMFFEPSGTLSATMSRRLVSTIQSIPSSGTLVVTAIGLLAGTNIGHLAFMTGATGEVGGTHGWYVLCDNNMKVLAVTADQTGATFFAANTYTQLAVGTPIIAQYSGLYYIGVMVAATTVPSMQGAPSLGTNVNAVPPILSGTSSTGQTTPPAVGTTLTAISASAGFDFYATVAA